MGCANIGVFAGTGLKTPRAGCYIGKGNRSDRTGFKPKCNRTGLDPRRATLRPAPQRSGLGNFPNCKPQDINVMHQIDHNRAAILAPPIALKIGIRLSHGPDDLHRHHITNLSRGQTGLQLLNHAMIPAMMAHERRNLVILQDLRQLARLLETSGHRFLDQHRPPPRSRFHTVGCMQMGRGGDDHPIHCGSDLRHGGKARSINLQRHIRIGQSDKATLRMRFDRLQMADANQSAANH